MRSKKFLSLMLAVVMVLGSFALAFAEEPILLTTLEPDTSLPTDILIAPAPNNDIVILHTNDIHCGYLPFDKLATLAKSADLLVDAGDAIQGDTIGTLSKGEYVTDIMNYLGYDFGTFGNHEFDYSLDQLKKIVEKADFPYACCNLVDLRTGESLFDAYKVLEVKGKKIAFVGVATPETLVKSTPTYFQDGNGTYIYGFCEGNNGADLYAAVQKAVTAAKAEADYVIVVAHLGIDEESAPWRVTDVVSHVSGIDAVIDGHSHSTYASTLKDKDGKNVPAGQTGTKLENAGKLTIKADGTITVETVALADVSADADATAFIQTITDKFDGLQKTVVARTTVNLTTKDAEGNRAVRNHETNLGDLCADAYKEMLGADVAFVNGGGVRADIPAGDITFGQIVSVHPFGNVACLAEVTGQQILDALELGSSSMPKELGGFLQVSGLTYTINTAIPSSVILNDQSEFVKVAGQRRVSDVKVGGVAIDPAKTYKLASHNYMLKSCGDGYTMFGTNKINLLRDEVMIDNQVLINYIVDKLGGTVGSQYAQAQGRITIIDDASKILSASDCAKDEACFLNRYADVKIDAWYHDGLHFCFANGIMNGMTATTFAPNEATTRAQIITMLWRMAGTPYVNYAVNFQFTDLVEGSWYYEAVRWAAAEKIVDGMTDTTFAPNATITREQLATMIYRYEQKLGKGFTGAWMFLLGYEDTAKISDWAYESVAWCTMKGVMDGLDGNIVAPKTTATRAQAATMLYRLTNVQ